MNIAKLFALVILVASCSAAHATADALYTSEQLQCVDKATTLSESKACRKAVDQKWGVSDASAPASQDASTGGDASK